MQLHQQRDHPPCPAATTYRGDQRWLGRLRTVGLVLPLVFLVALQALHLFVVRPFLPQGGEWAVTGVAALAALAFGITMFHLIQQGHAIVLTQNRELGALNVVSTALTDDLGVDELMASGIDTTMALTRAIGCTVVGAIPLDSSLRIPASTWQRGRTDGDPARDVTIALQAGRDDMGVMTLHFDSDAPATGLSTETLRHVGQQLGSALLRALLIEHLGERTALIAAREQREATLAERERIARELHDSLAQVLGVTHLRLRAATGRPELADAHRVRDDLDDLATMVHEAYTDVRESILGLREASRTDRTLLQGIESSVSAFSRLSGIDASLTGPDVAIPLDPDAEVQCLRIIQEALTNVRKHARASRVEVRVTASDTEATFSVDDDGQGFDSGGHSGDDHYGLRSMRERAESIDGRLRVESRPGEGTRVELVLPTIATTDVA